jgi:uncharacterized FlgJ-related protein
MKKIIIFTITLSLLSFSLPSKKIAYQYHKPVIIDTPLNEENLISYLKEKNVRFLKLTLAQAKHESANFTSELCKSNHNLFGMRKAEIRPTTALGTKNKYALYKSWKESVDDFVLFQTFVLKRVKTQHGYQRYISSQYAADRNYWKKLKKYL